MGKYCMLSRKMRFLEWATEFSRKTRSNEEKRALFGIFYEKDVLDCRRKDSRFWFWIGSP